MWDSNVSRPHFFFGSNAKQDRFMNFKHLWHYQLVIIVVDNVVAQTHFNRVTDLVFHSFQHLFPADLVSLHYPVNAEVYRSGNADNKVELRLCT